MSEIFGLVCHETKKYISIGQGWGEMESFWSGMEQKMKDLHQFLCEHEKHPLFFLNLDRWMDEIDDDLFGEYEELENGKYERISP